MKHIYQGSANRLSAVLVAALCLLLAPAAQATTITVVSLGFYEYPVELIVNGSPVSDVAGQINITIDGGSPIVAYCVDLYTSIGYSTYTTAISTPDSISNGERAAWLHETQAPLVANNQDAAALQLALWDIVHDGGDSLEAGNIQLAPAAPQALRDAANTLITLSVGMYSTNATILHNVSLSGNTPAQSLIIAPLPAPEPGSLWMLGAGAAVLAGLARTRRRSG